MSVKRKKQNTESYGIYIRKVLKQVHGDVSISKDAIAIMDRFVNDIFRKIAEEAGRLTKYSKKRTLTSKEMKTSVKLVLPEELANHAVCEASKSLNKYNISKVK